MKRTNYFSKYLTMRDGVHIAIDVWLPDSPSRPVPTILRQTRYFRSIRLRFPFSLFVGNRPIDHTGLYRRRRNRFLKSGYAWIDVDVRGSGASTGYRLSPWSADEIEDGREIVDWIIGQSWSDGQVGSMGISYDGTASEMLLVNRHPAVTAVAPRFACFDPYADIGFPGGVFNRWFNQHWGEMNYALDANRLSDIAGWYVRLLTSGVSRVDADRDRSVLSQAIKDHKKNYNVIAGGRQLQFCDDVPPAEPGVPSVSPKKFETGLRGTQLFSPATHRVETCESGAAVFSVAGWWDGAYARAAAERFHAVPNPGSRLLIGPWNHGGGWHVEPASRYVRNRFDHDSALVDFFDTRLKPQESETIHAPPVCYYTLIESKWKTAETWPPPHVSNETFFLTSDGLLDPEKPASFSASEYQAVAIGSGTESRWRTQASVDGPVRYRDRRRLGERLLSFRSPALPDPLECAGHPVAEFFLATDSPETYLFVYLEDVAPDGSPELVTEGLFNTRHRKLITPAEALRPGLVKLGIPQHSFLRQDDWPMEAVAEPRAANDAQIARIEFDLFPISWLFRAGHSIQISISGSDTDHFQGPQPLPKIALFHGAEFASRLRLPLAKSDFDVG